MSHGPEVSKDSGVSKHMSILIEGPKENKERTPHASDSSCRASLDSAGQDSLGTIVYISWRARVGNVTVGKDDHVMGKDNVPRERQQRNWCVPRGTLPNSASHLSSATYVCYSGARPTSSPCHICRIPNTISRLRHDHGPSLQLPIDALN